LNHNDFI